MTIEQIKELKRKKIITHNYPNEFFANMTLEELKRKKFITSVGFTMEEKFENELPVEPIETPEEPIETPVEAIEEVIEEEPIVEEIEEEVVIEEEPEIEE